MKRLLNALEKYAVKYPLSTIIIGLALLSIFASLINSEVEIAKYALWVGYLTLYCTIVWEACEETWGTQAKS